MVIPLFRKRSPLKRTETETEYVHQAERLGYEIFDNENNEPNYLAVEG